MYVFILKQKTKKTRVVKDSKPVFSVSYEGYGLHKYLKYLAILNFFNKLTLIHLKHLVACIGLTLTPLH